MSLLVDTSGLYALMVATEAKHAAVKKTFAAAMERGRPLVTTSYVLLETVALLQHRIGLAPLRDLDGRPSRSSPFATSTRVSITAELPGYSSLTNGA